MHFHYWVKSTFEMMSLGVSPPDQLDFQGGCPEPWPLTSPVIPWKTALQGVVSLKLGTSSGSSQDSCHLSHWYPQQAIRSSLMDFSCRFLCETFPYSCSHRVKETWMLMEGKVLRIPRGTQSETRPPPKLWVFFALEINISSDLWGRPSWTWLRSASSHYPESSIGLHFFWVSVSKVVKVSYQGLFQILLES